MSSDAFTNTDGTTLPAHNAAWGTLSGYSAANCVIYGNQLRTTSGWTGGGALRTDSTADACQFVHKALTNGTAVNKRVHVRASLSNQGYAALLGTISAGNYTRVTLQKNGAYLTQAVISVPITADHTIKITAAGSNPVSIEVLVDGASALTYSDSSSPIASGSPGISVSGYGQNNDNYIDDWTDSSDAAIYVESIVAVSISAIAIDDQQQYCDTQQITGAAVTAVSDIQTYQDQVQIAVQALLATIDTPVSANTESLLVTAIAAVQASDRATYIDAVADLASIGISVADAQTWVESVLVAITANTPIVDLSTVPTRITIYPRAAFAWTDSASLDFAQPNTALAFVANSDVAFDLAPYTITLTEAPPDFDFMTSDGVILISDGVDLTWQ